MKTIPFIWREEGSLTETLSQPFDRLNVHLDMIRRPLCVWLCHRQAVATQIGSKMYDVAPRIEVGVLEFSKSGDRHDNELSLDVPEAFGVVVAIEKLIIDVEDVSAESGVAFKNARGDEIVIVAGAQPYGLAVRVPWDAPVPRVDPEYCLSEYRRIAMN
jgi:hypothetical protein